MAIDDFDFMLITVNLFYYGLVGLFSHYPNPSNLFIVRLFLLILAVIIETTLFNLLTWTKEFSKTQHQTKHRKQEEKLEKKTNTRLGKAEKKRRKTHEIMVCKQT